MEKKRDGSTLSREIPGSNPLMLLLYILRSADQKKFENIYSKKWMVLKATATKVRGIEEVVESSTPTALVSEWDGCPRGAIV